MRIARVLTRLDLGGPARQVLASDPRLVRRGHSVRVFAGTSEPGAGDLFEAARERGIDVVRVPGLAQRWSVAGDLRARRFLRAALTEFAPDVVHTHDAKAGALGHAASRKLTGAVRVHTCDGEGRDLLRDIDRVIAVSHATADELLRLGVVDEERVVVVPPGLELESLLALEQRSTELRGLLAAGDDVWLVGVVGRLSAAARPELAIEVFQVLAERYPQLQLVFLGDGDQRRLLERRIGGLPVGQRERVHLVGAVERLAPALADLDAVLATARVAGLPLELVEAAAAALPVVAARAGGTAEVVAEERTGFLGDTVDELAYGLSRLLDDPRLGPAMGRRGRIRVAERHGADALAERLEALYAALIEERRCAS